MSCSWRKRTALQTHALATVSSADRGVNGALPLSLLLVSPNPSLYPSPAGALMILFHSKSRQMDSCRQSCPLFTGWSEITSRHPVHKPNSKTTLANCYFFCGHRRTGGKKGK
ncbi:hypothetical protein SKAU_G00274740 [Synaphobranchus kaupii]|uniref:Uncharacterized protein n=1 Tax=Synaphobranchus kaupii TaxID=118154 RepID=A0A9Q1IQ18_SYNKA|nr:hypothetical protein SKAU_G00274740 [Synaphobranchus kaupii]